MVEKAKVAATDKVDEALAAVLAAIKQNEEEVAAMPDGGAAMKVFNQVQNGLAEAKSAAQASEDLDTLTERNATSRLNHSINWLLAPKVENKKD